MSDLIRRSDVIKTIDDNVNGSDNRLYLKDLVNAIPSADRPRGEWIEQEDDYHHYWECSECGIGVGLDDIRNFCPNCGARMKGADDE